MKSKLINRLIAFSLISITAIAAMPKKASAAWISNYYGGWAYSDGYHLATGWKWIDGKWYYFNSNGYMMTGWINDGGKWYYLDGNGVMQTGVIQVEGKVYLMSNSGDMQVGLAVVNGKEYNFADNGACIGNDIPMPKIAFDYFGTPTVPFIPSQIINTNVGITNELPSDGQEKTIEYKITYKDKDNILEVRKFNADEKARIYEPSKNGYNFVEWNTDQDGDGKSYKADELITLTKDITLYAQWERKKDNNTDAENEIIKVTSINIKVPGNVSSSGVATISNDSKVQLSAIVTPSNATDRKVEWSIQPSTTGGKATISSNGVLTTTSQGFITVVAKSKDGAYAERKILIE